MTTRGLRIVAGHLGGRRVRSAPDSRPTQERVREALFSRWQQHLEGAFFVDLFCGGGAVGLEALSRGAQSCLFVDANSRSLEIVRSNASRLGIEGHCQQRQAELPEQWAQIVGLLGNATEHLLVYADPPYDFTQYETLASLIGALDRTEAAAIEHSSRSHWAQAEESEARRTTRRYGETALTFL